VNDNTSLDVAQECATMAGSYTRTVCNKNFGTVSSSYSCIAESIWQYLGDRKDIC